MSVAVGSCGEAVGYARINFRIVSEVGSDKEVIVLWSHNFRKIIEVGNLLNESSYDPSAFLEQSLVLPVTVDGAKFPGTAVMLSHPDSVHDGERELLVATHVSTEEAIHSVGASHDLLVVNGQRRKVAREIGSGKEASTTELTNSVTDYFI